MNKVIIYTTTYCGFCVAAKKLLKDLEIPFLEIDVTTDDEKRVWLVQRTGQRTVPQILIGDKPIGGYTDLAAKSRSGELQALLASVPS